MVSHIFGLVLVVVFVLDLALAAGVLLGPVVALVVRRRHHGHDPRVY